MLSRLLPSLRVLEVAHSAFLHLAMELSPCDDRKPARELCVTPVRVPRSCSPFDDHVRGFRWVATVRVRLSTITSCSPSRCLRSRSPFDVRARIHVRVLPSSVLANVPRRSPPCSRPFAPCGAPGRVHLLVFVSAFAFRRSRPFTLRRLTVHGLASTCHVSTAFTAILFREPPLHTAPVSRARAHLATITFALPYHRAFAWSPPLWAEMSAIPRPKLAPLPRHPDRPASLDAHDLKALPCSRSRNVFTCFALGFRLELTYVHARVHFAPCGAIEHTHCARSYSAYCHRESLAFSSPNSPSCSSF
jgi:hypothetical protein